ncbi:alpha amylase N-terminal ig-like domain-containing protein [bacterium]|nr:alpha amylase N-terminal ig-like domain-containing protein [bacterium]
MKKMFFYLILFATASIAREVVFSYSPNVTAESVNIAGSFNNWSKDETPMSDPESDGKWSVTLDLPDGEYQYKFVVNGATWIQDPNNPKGAPDGFAGSNSVIVVGDWEKFTEVASRGDGKILDAAIWHENTIPYLCDDGKGYLWVRVRVKKDDVQAVHILTRNPIGEIDSKPMRYLCSEFPFEWFELDIPFTEPISYHFWVLDKGAEFIFPKNEGEFTTSPGKAPVFSVPDWARGTLFYQIFPERFANGNPSNDPQGTVPWGNKPEIDNFMGGDLAGVIDHLPYLDSLGVGAIYFNPIFEASSNHKYDTWDYLKIDDNFGSNELFKTLDKKTEELDIMIVLDGVFNHIGFGSPIFKDVVEKGIESKFADWFFIHEYPVHGPENPNYEAWWGFGSLPKMNTNNPEVREYLFGAIRYWIENGVDGWRLDVAPDVPHEFWKAFRDTIRKIDSEAYSVGEIWGDGSQWLGGDEFDAVMNYRFRDAMIEFFAKSNILPSDFLDRLGAYIADYASPVNEVQMNLLGSHDTPRFLTIAHEESWRSRLALIWALIWPGAPCIYYGDEIGMIGEHDPGCREAFPWNKIDTWNDDILSTVRYLSSVRKRNACLRLGSFRPLIIDDDAKIVAIERRFGDELAVVAVNLSENEYLARIELLKANSWAPEDRIPFPIRKTTRVTEVFTGNRYYEISPLEFTIPAHDARVFIVN